MGKLKGPDCRICRVERTKLFLKGSKCLSDKCPLEKRPYPPGEHGRRRRRILGYGIQLREKQRLKRYYGMSERQFRLFFDRAERMRGITGENLLSMLERRLDNIIYIIGFAHSRAHARQLITHRHFRLNDHKATVPSMLVNPGDVITLSEKARENENIKAVAESNSDKTLPGWVEVDYENLEAKVIALPKRGDITLPVEEHLVVELYSK